MSFPKNFLWGVAGSAGQNEGGYNEGNRGLTTMDVMTLGSRQAKRKITDGIVDGEYYPGMMGSDFYHRYKEDIQKFSELNINAIRTSIAWSRIFPNGDDQEPNEEGLQFYEDVFTEMKKHGIEPIVTLSHFDVPLGLKKYGFWEGRETVDHFVKYATIVFERYKDLVSWWLTFNEINCMSTQPWVAGGVNSDDEGRRMTAAYHQLLASAKVVKIGHEINPNNMIGMMYAGHFSYANSPDPEDVLHTMEFDHQMMFYIDVQARGAYPRHKLKQLERQNITLPAQPGDEQILKEGTVDYISFSYYLTHVTGKKTTGITKGLNGLDTGYKNPHLQYSDWGWGIDPKGLRFALNYLYDHWNLPVMVVENGLGAIDQLEDGKVHDPYRIEYLKEHIREMKKAIEFDGVEVLGYTPWAGLDMPSLSTGEMAKRYGLLYVDADDHGNGSYDRYEKDSFAWYKEVCSSNGEKLGD